jgi:hypothetical protein
MAAMARASFSGFVYHSSDTNRFPRPLLGNVITAKIDGRDLCWFFGQAIRLRSLMPLQCRRRSPQRWQINRDRPWQSGTTIIVQLVLTSRIDQAEQLIRLLWIGNELQDQPNEELREPLKSVIAKKSE